MNYRHIYHAGNFADVMKHLVLILCLEYLKEKEKPFCALDAQAGTGLYDLSSIEAEKTGEWKNGIDLFLKLKSQNTDILRIQNFFENDVLHKRYPGSPLIIARMLREQDKSLANELHPDDSVRLKNTLHSYKNIKTFSLDAYEFLRAHLPPVPRRGLVLIDPPFEKTDEFELLIQQMKEWEKRWETGTYILWYPIKPHLNVKGLRQAIKENGFEKNLIFETMLYPQDQTEVLNGCGVIVINPPFLLENKLNALQADLKSALKLYESRVSVL